MRFLNGARPFFDFAIFDKFNNLKFLIEYNGSQHYNYSSSGWNTKENWILIKNRDQQKIEMCKSLNIPLEIISFAYFSNLEKIIQELLIKYNILEEKIQ